MVRMRSPVQVWSAAPLKNTPLRVCFFNAFLTHLRDLFLNRAWSLSSALDAFSCKQSLIFACRQQLIKYRLFTTKTSCFFNAFLTHLRDLFLNRAWSLSSALDAFSCKQSLIFACRQQLIKYRLFTTKTSCFFNVCKVFCTHLHNFFEIVRGACRLRSAIANTSCSHRLLLPSAALWSILS